MVTNIQLHEFQLTLRMWCDTIYIQNIHDLHKMDAYYGITKNCIAYDLVGYF